MSDLHDKLAAILPESLADTEALEEERLRLNREQAKAALKMAPNREVYARLDEAYAKRLQAFESNLWKSAMSDELNSFHDATVLIARKVQALGYQGKRLDQPSEVNKQLKQVFDKLNKLGHVARMHLHDVTGEDIVDQMLQATQATYSRMDMDTFINNMVVRLAKDELTGRDITCSNAANGKLVQYVQIIAESLGMEGYNAQFQVRRYLEKV